MPHQEKRAWIMLIVAVVAYAAYVITIVGRTDGRSPADVPYAAALLWTVGAAILANIVLEIVLGMTDPRSARIKDERDQQVRRFGEYTGQSFVVIGGVAGMLMALADWDQFWIANVIYLCFVLSAVLGSITKIIAYRKTFPQW